MKRKKLANVLAALSLVVATASANMVCYWWYNQPSFPEKAKKLRKF